MTLFWLISLLLIVVSIVFNIFFYSDESDYRVMQTVVLYMPSTVTTDDVFEIIYDNVL